MKNFINIGIPSKGRLRKDVLKIFTKKKLKLQFIKEPQKMILQKVIGHLVAKVQF